MGLDLEALQALPKVSLHDHLDGGLRPQTIIELAADGVIYAEARWAPEQHLRAGLTLAEAVEAVRDGLAEGMAACRTRGQEIEVRQMLTAMRQAEPTLDVAELTLRYRNRDVAGFDLAGPENGYPPSRFLESFQ